MMSLCKVKEFCICIHKVVHHIIPFSFAYLFCNNNFVLFVQSFLECQFMFDDIHKINLSNSCIMPGICGGK